MTDLTRRLAARLDETFPELVAEMGPRLYWGLRRLTGDPMEAEDLTQETFIRAYRALQGYERSRVIGLALGPWLWTIALNLGRNHLRDRDRLPTPVVADDYGLPDPEPPDGQAWDRRLGRLTRDQRRSVVLRHVVGMSVAEIVQVTGRPEGTVKSDIHRGLGKLRALIEEEG